MIGFREDLIIQGRTAPDPDELHLLYGLARTIDIRSADGLYTRRAISMYPRQLLESVNGFDEGFGALVWGEDTDLGMRAEAQGSRLEFAEDALAWHAVHPNPLPHAIRDAGRRRRLARVLARHPRLRRKLIGRVFVNKSHALAALVLIGGLGAVATPGRRRLVLAASLSPYFVRAAVESAAAGRTGLRASVRVCLHTPVRLIVDVAETLATLRGAVEERTFVV